MIEETPTTLGGGPTVCPFVAFEDDRDHRSGAPDYRHRCFASAEPEPRAFPHQERYCLAPDFAECPVFLDWARQEAAAVATSGAGSADSDGAEGQETPAFLSRRSRPEAAVAGGSGRRASSSTSLWSYDEPGRSPVPTAPVAPSSLGQPMVAMARRGPTHPGWENPPRLETFPRLRARDDRRANQPLLLAAVAVAVLMVALVVIPIVLNGRGGGGGGANNAPTAGNQASGPAVTTAPTPTAAPSFLRYRVQKDDNFSSIASRFNLLPWELALANPQVTDPNVLQIGEILLIPPPGYLTLPPSTAAPAGS